MNHDENKPEMQTWIEPELEARVVAWVSGEASAFESAELERLVGEKPELALFKERIETVRGLVKEAARPDQEPLRLAPERRAKLLQTLTAGDGPPSAEDVVKKPDAPAVFPLYSGRQYRRTRWWRTATVAAGLMLGLFFSTLIKYSANKYADETSFQKHKRPEATLMELRSLPMDPEGASKRLELAKQTKSTDKRGQVEEKAINYDRLAPSAQPPSEERRDASAVNGPSPSDSISEKDVLALSSLKVSADRDQGYLASNSFAGSRSAKKAVQNSPEMTLGGAVDSYYVGRSPTTEAAPLSNPRLFEKGAPEQFEYTKNARSREEKGTLSYYNDAIKPPTALLDSQEMRFAAGKPKAQSKSYAGSNEQTAQDKETIVLSPFEVVSNGETAAAPPLSVTGPHLAAARQSVPESPLLTKQVAEIDQIVADLKKTEAPASPPAGEAVLADEKLAPKQSGAGSPEAIVVTPVLEVNAAQQPVSTFSLHVSDVSFRLAQAALARGELPEATSIRPEEFYNAFNYGDPAPAMAEKVACHIEQSAFPFLQQRNLVRIAMKVPAVGRGAAQPLRLTVMLDTSGSMEREDRAAIAHRAMEALVSLLGPNDRLTVVGFARQPHLLVDQLPGDKAGEALTAIARTPSEGGTDLEAALKLAGELALRGHQSGAQNRIVLLTDGAANLGDANPAQLASAIEALRQQGVAFDACGVGLDGIDDAMLERLTRKGDGRYYVLNTPEAADAGFARQLAGAFRPAAENVKVQVRFNPSRVGAYRLIGFEQHRLKEEDFRNDQVDAAELAAEEAAVAVYQVETLPQGEGEIGEVYVRFRDASNGNMVERSWTLSYNPQVAAFDHAAPSMQLAGVAVLLAEKLRGGPLADGIRLDELAPVVNALRGHYAHEPRVQELVTMYEQLRRMKPE